MEDVNFFNSLKRKVEDYLDYEAIQKLKRFEKLLKKGQEKYVFVQVLKKDCFNFYIVENDSFIYVVKQNMNFNIYNKKCISKIEVKEDINLCITIYVDDKEFCLNGVGNGVTEDMSKEMSYKFLKELL